MKGKSLRFGGPNLRPGQHTWYHDLGKPTTARAVGSRVETIASYEQVIVHPGDVVDAARVQNAEDYVARGQAEWFVPGTLPEPDPPPPKETEATADAGA